MIPYSRARPPSHWLDYPDTTYGTVGSAEFGKWDLALYEAKGRALVVTESEYAADPTGATDTLANIQQAIDDAAANAAAGSGPTEVVVPAGTYTGGLRQISVQRNSSKTIAALLWGRSNVTLTLMPGATIKLKDNATMPGSCTEGHGISVVDPFNLNADGSGIKTNWSIVGRGVVDFNGNNQGALTLTPYFSGAVWRGIYHGVCKNSLVQGLTVKNLYGLSNAPPTESYHFDCLASRDIAYVACEADGSGATHTSTGFSNGYSFASSYTACKAHDLAHGMGFTFFETAGVTASGCHAYLCGSNGYNLERSSDISYSACISGGKSYYSADVPTTPFFPSGQVSMGNNVGWSITGGSRVQLDGACIAAYNTTNGIKIGTNQANTVNALVSTNVHAHGTFIGTVAGESSNVYIETGGDFTGAQNTGNSCYVWGKTNESTDIGPTFTSRSPIESFKAVNTSSGKRHVISGFSTTAFSWQRSGFDANPDLKILGSGQVATTGRVKARTATAAAAYTVLVTDDYVACTGTATTAQTITLPSAATAGAGAVYTIKDEAGSAATHNITVARAGSNTIDGATSVTISTNYGTCRVISTGTNWAVI